MISHEIEIMCPLRWVRRHVIMKFMVLVILLVQFDICFLKLEYIDWSHNWIICLSEFKWQPCIRIRYMFFVWRGCFSSLNIENMLFLVFFHALILWKKINSSLFVSGNEGKWSKRRKSHIDRYGFGKSNTTSQILLYCKE